jgi:beta-glucosidase-like glycosyl hydrolase
MTLEHKIGQFFFPAVFINDTEENILATEELIKNYNIGGLTFFHSRASAATNYESKQKVELNDSSYDRLKDLIGRYQKCAPTPLLISIDAEWGLAMRVEKTPQYPYAITVGALPETESHLVYEMGKQIGLDLKSAGINYNLAPLADLNNNPDNPVIGYRSFGENKEKVALFALEYLRGLKEVGVLGCLKHFPGHGNTNVDSHLGLPILKETMAELMDNELYPFIRGIEQNVDSIMIGHLAVPSLNNGKNTSATLSKNIIEDLLRKQLNYDGLVISDALNMHSVSKLYTKKGQLEWEAFNAGNDILCFAENVAEGIQEILKNATAARIEESYNRIKRCKEKLDLWNPSPSIAPVFDFEKTAFLNEKIAKQSLTKIKDIATNASVFEASKKGTLAVISLYQSAENIFFKTINESLTAPQFTLQNGFAENLIKLNKDIVNFDTAIVSLFVPNAKPMNNFGIDDAVLAFLENIFLSKKCVLYVFGNPYTLQIIPHIQSAIGIVQAYQNFEVFQEQAALQLVGNLECKGTLAVHIKGI